jgi:hypothetical protein
MVAMRVATGAGLGSLMLRREVCSAGWWSRLDLGPQWAREGAWELDGQEQLAAERRISEYTRPRKARLSEKPVLRRVLTVRGAYRLAYKRSLTLGGLDLSGAAGGVFVGAYRGEPCPMGPCMQLFGRLAARRPMAVRARCAPAR